MRMKLAALLILLALLLGGCNFWVVEDAPVQVGSVYIQN